MTSYLMEWFLKFKIYKTNEIFSFFINNFYDFNNCVLTLITIKNSTYDRSQVWTVEYTGAVGQLPPPPV